MIEELRKLVETRLSEAPGLVAMVISDLEGVPVLQAQVAGANNQVCPPTQFSSIGFLQSRITVNRVLSPRAPLRLTSVGFDGVLRPKCLVLHFCTSVSKKI